MGSWLTEHGRALACGMRSALILDAPGAVDSARDLLPYLGGAVMVLAAVSIMAGKWVVMAANRLSWRSTLIILVRTAVGAFLFGGCESCVILGITGMGMGNSVSYPQIIGAVGLAFAPYAFGLLIALPYSGRSVLHLLRVWHVVVLWRILHIVLDTSDVLALLAALGAWLAAQAVLAALRSPVGASSWRRGAPSSQPMMTWSRIKQMDDVSTAQIPALACREENHYLVYLSGIGVSYPGQVPSVEVPMLDLLIQRLGDTRVVRELMPYSVTNDAPWAGSPAGRIWQTLSRFKTQRSAWLRMLGFLVNVRNALKIFVSADSRYGPLFNRAIAENIAAALLKQGYRPEHRRPVTLLGWSGGAQVAVGSCQYLCDLGIPVRIISVAGSFAANPGLLRVKQTWHICGERDKVADLSVVLDPGRWPIFRHSPWNQAVGEGRLRTVQLNGLKHVGSGGYFADFPLLEDGRTPRMATADCIVNLLVEAGLAVDRGQ